MVPARYAPWLMLSDYDLAMTYTYALHDEYTDYKSIWKTLQIGTHYSLEQRSRMTDNK